MSSCPFSLIPMPAFSNVLRTDQKAPGLPSICFDDQVRRDSSAPGLIHIDVMQIRSFPLTKGSSAAELLISPLLLPHSFLEELHYPNLAKSFSCVFSVPTPMAVD